MRGNQLTRQWRILRLIEASRNGLTVAEVNERVGGSPRTTYRDLDDLQNAGFPLYAESSKSGSRWKFVEDYKLKLPTPFTLTELLSFQLSEDLFQVFRGTVFHDSLEDLIEKVKALLPPETIAFLSKVRTAYKMGGTPLKDYSRFRELIGRVNQAVLDRRTMEIAYQSLKSAEPTWRRIDPYKIWFYDGTIYVIGFCHLRGEVRTFVLDRVNLLNLTEAVFKLPIDFSFENYVRHSFKVMKDELYSVRIRISREWARYVGESIWHDSQQIQKLMDGGIEISFRVAGLDEIRQWVMGMGPEVRVIEPPELVTAVMEGFSHALAQYPPGVIHDEQNDTKFQNEEQYRSMATDKRMGRS
jgi:predicted DNA-binding transcriptional regulator YafY